MCDVAVDDLRMTTVLTLEALSLGVGLSPLSCPCPPPPLPDPPLSLWSELEVVEPELTPLELCRTRLGEWWMFLVEHTVGHV